MSRMTCNLILYFSLCTAALSPCVCVVCFTVCLILGPFGRLFIRLLINKGQAKKEMFLVRISLTKTAVGTF